MNAVPLYQLEYWLSGIECNAIVAGSGHTDAGIRRRVREEVRGYRVSVRQAQICAVICQYFLCSLGCMLHHQASKLPSNFGPLHTGVGIALRVDQMSGVACRVERILCLLVYHDRLHRNLPLHPCRNLRIVATMASALCKSDCTHSQF